MNDFIAISAGLGTFVTLTVLMFSHLKTPLSFLPVIAISVAVGLTSPRLYARIKKSN